jgi:hypothetical protein
VSQIRAAVQARLFHHATEQLSKQFRVSFIELFVAIPDVLRGLGASVCVSLHRVLHHDRYEASEADQGRAQWEALSPQSNSAVGHVLGIIANALKLTGNPQIGEDLAEVTRDWLAQRQRTNDPPCQ